MKKISTSQKVILIAFTLFGFVLQAQTYYADGLIATKNLTVDLISPDGATPDGSIGSWYKWNPAIGVTTTATFTANDDTDGTGNNDGNQAVISWNAVWPAAGGDPLKLIQDYKISAEEFNSCQSTTSTATSKTEIEVKLVKPDILKIDSDTEACASTNATITLYGTPGAVVNFTVTNSTTTATSATFGTDGIVNVDVTPNGNGNIVFTIVNVTFTATQPAPLSSPISYSATTFTNGTNTVTVNVNKAPVISPIQF